MPAKPKRKPAPAPAAAPAKPVRITPAVFARICEELSMGHTLTQICTRKGYPKKRSFLAFLAAADAATQHQYAQARARCMDSWADEIIAIAKDGSKDIITEVKDGRTIKRVDHENINRSRLIVDTMKWSMSKLAPRTYGDSLQVDQQTTLQAGDSLAALMNSIRHRTKPVSPLPCQAQPSVALPSSRSGQSPSLPGSSTPEPDGAFTPAAHGQFTPAQAGRVPPPFMTGREGGNGDALDCEQHPRQPDGTPTPADVLSLQQERNRGTPTPAPEIK